jgi:hypothetical protein
MQVCLNITDSIALVNIFGVDYFDTINVRDSGLEIIQKNIQPSFLEENRYKNFLKDIRKIAKENPSCKFEFIKK